MAEHLAGRTSNTMPSEQDLRLSTGDVIVHDGALLKDGMRIEYETMQPSPMQWVAMCVVPVAAGSDSADTTHRLIVGTGGNEEQAIALLRERVTHLAEPIQIAPRCAVPIPLDPPTAVSG